MRNRVIMFALAALVLVFGNLLWFAPGAPGGKPIVGRVEYAALDTVDMKFKSRIDTGAGVSSLNAKIIEIKKPANPQEAERILFELTDENGYTRRIEREITQWNNIKSKGAKGTTKRPVVIMDVCLGGKRLEGRFNLTDRSDFIYPMLIGRNMLKAGDFLIDPERKFMKSPGCL